MIDIIHSSNESYSDCIYRQQAELPSAVVEWLKDEVTLTDASVAKVQNYLTSDEVGLTKLSEILELDEEMVQHIAALLAKRCSQYRLTCLPPNDAGCGNK